MVVLMTVGPGSQLALSAGLSYLRCRADGCPPGITSAHRTWARQQYLRSQYLAGVPGFNFALPPELSDHVKGTALDLPGDAHDPRTPRGWMRLRGERHGWRGIPNEEWHFGHFPELDLVAQREDDDMYTDEDRARDVMIRKAQTTMNARQLMIWRELQGLDLDGIAEDMATAMAPVVEDAVVAALAEAEVNVTDEAAHQIAVRTTSRLANLAKLNATEEP